MFYAYRAFCADFLLKSFVVGGGGAKYDFFSRAQVTVATPLKQHLYVYDNRLRFLDIN